MKRIIEAGKMLGAVLLVLLMGGFALVSFAVGLVLHGAVILTFLAIVRGVFGWLFSF